MTDVILAAPFLFVAGALTANLLAARRRAAVPEQPAPVGRHRRTETTTIPVAVHHQDGSASWTYPPPLTSDNTPTEVLNLGGYRARPMTAQWPARP